MTKTAEQVAEIVAYTVNGLLHEALGKPPCATACTHNIAEGWTALGLSNVVKRAVEKAAPR